MRIKNSDDIKKLGVHAQRQINAALQRGGINNKKRISDVAELAGQHRKGTSELSVGTKTSLPPTGLPAPDEEANPSLQKKKNKPSRVMRTEDGLPYCPWPSPDPFVAVIQRLETKFGRYDDGGLLVTELIVDGGEKDWRFDIALLSPLKEIDVFGRSMLIGHTCLIEADGFGFHRSKEAFKNDRSKQTHALKQGFPVKRITNDDARNRLDEVIEDIELIFAQPRLYEGRYSIHAKGKTQCILRWFTCDEKV